MQNWSALDILKQVSSEVGLPVPNTVVAGAEVVDQQLLGALNAAGNELVTVYPWAFLSEDWQFSTINGQGNYDLPSDWCYFADQTQWDTTNHWPLLGPKSPQEWAWLRGGIVAPAPRLRYRVRDNQFQLWPVPVPGAGGVFTPFVLRMEYVRDTWLSTQGDAGTVDASMITKDADKPYFNPWLLIKFTKAKFYQTKGFVDQAKIAQMDFVRMFNSLTGKDVGAEKLSMSPQYSPQFIGMNNVPDGNWNV